jgi:hypothetical protein
MDILISSSKPRITVVIYHKSTPTPKKDTERWDVDLPYLTRNMTVITKHASLMSQGTLGYTETRIKMIFFPVVYTRRRYVCICVVLVVAVSRLSDRVSTLERFTRIYVVILFLSLKNYSLMSSGSVAFPLSSLNIGAGLSTALCISSVYWARI